MLLDRDIGLDTLHYVWYLYGILWWEVQDVRKPIYRAQPGGTCLIPLFGSGVRAGFPSPGDDYVETELDIGSYLVRHPSATFFVRAQGHSMEGAGIFDGDLLIVDRSRKPVTGAIVIAAIDGAFTVKRLIHRNGKAFLQAANDHIPPIDLGEAGEVILWGMVTHAIHEFLK